MTTAAKGDLERRHQRASCDAPAEFSWGTITHSASVVVVSMVGCFPKTGVIVPVGQELDLTFCLESGPNPIRCRARVVWHDGRGIKVRAGSLSGLAEEAPSAYKDVDAVVETVVAAGIARKVARLRPLAVIKG